MQGREQVAFRVGPAESAVEPFRQDAAIMDQDGSDRRIRRDRSASASGQIEGAAHPDPVLLVESLMWPGQD
jgi:hypothetical protein